MAEKDSFSMAQDLLNFQIQRNFKLLLKSFLELLEDNYNQHDTMITKIKESIPQELHGTIDKCNYLTDSRKAFLRKRVLDGNDRLRELEELLKTRFEITFNGNH